MKRRLLTLVTLTLTLITLTIPAHSATFDYCSETASPACRELYVASLMNCLNNTANTWTFCHCQALGAKNTCMEQFGCPGHSEQVMIEQGCGPQ